MLESNKMLRCYFMFSRHILCGIIIQTDISLFDIREGVVCTQRLRYARKENNVAPLFIDCWLLVTLKVVQLVVEVLTAVILKRSLLTICRTPYGPIRSLKAKARPLFDES